VTSQPRGNRVHGDESLLVTVTGPDRPGVTATLFGALSGHAVVVTDVEQVVVRGHLVLGVVLVPATGTRVPAPDVVAGTLRHALGPLGLAVDVRRGGSEPLARRSSERSHVTVLGSPLLPRAVAAVAGRIAEHGGNIDRIDRLAAYPVTCVELQVSGVDPRLLRAVLATAATEERIDLAVEPSGLQRRAKRLVVMDVDSTLVQGEVIELLAARAGVLDEVAAVTGAAMRGELDFEASLRRRVSLLAGLPVAEVDAVRDAVALTPGARTLVRTLKRLGYRLGIVSGGFTQVTDALAAELGLDYTLANELAVADGRLTGGLVGAVVDRAAKAEALRRFAADAGVPLAQTVAIGDGANDLDMLAAAGLGVAFNAKPVVRAAADTAVNVPFLDAVLYLLGITREEVEAADAADGLTTPRPPVA
jgi:phosphoserine phosphatase